MTIKTANKDQPRLALIGENARTVMERLFLLRDENRELAETPFECMKRVAHHVAQGEPTPELQEKWETEYLEMLVELLASPNSPAYTGAGRENGMLSACFVLPIEDSIENIFEQVKRGAMVHKQGGGTGYAFDSIRETGALVSQTNGLASGPLSFLSVYDEATETIKQGSARRGANMGCLAVTHPDILDFITCKDRCDTCPTCGHRPPYSNFNLSVKATDEFMAAVKEGKSIDLISPAGGKAVKTLDARDIFDKIAYQAWKNGEPGVLFIDAMNRTNPTPEIGMYESTNPCVVGNSRLSVVGGLHRMDSLAAVDYKGLPFNVARQVIVDPRVAYGVGPGTGVEVGTPVRCTGKNKPVFTVVTEHGYEVTGTEYHEFVLADGSRKELKDLQVGDRLMIQSGAGIFTNDQAINGLHYQLGLVLGWLAGDGTIGGKRAELYFYGSDKAECADMLLQAVNATIPLTGENGRDYSGEPLQLLEQSKYGRSRVSSMRLKKLAASYGVTADTKLRVPECVWTGTNELVRGYLRALFSADGSVQYNEDKYCCSIRLAQSDKQFLTEVQVLLINLGIVSKLSLRRPASQRMLPDGNGGKKEYKCRADYELIISKKSRELFQERIGFIQNHKNETHLNWMKAHSAYAEDYTSDIIEITSAGNADVFCTTVPKGNSIIVNGIVTGNCGETALLPYEACCLASVHLANHLDLAKRDFDWKKLKRTVRTVVRFLDDLISINKYPFPEIHEAVERTRKIGLGIMGWADALIRLRIPYASWQGVHLSEKVMSFIKDAAWEMSVELAKERGPFPAVEFSIWKDTKEQPRNATLTTIAPTGTISRVFEASQGIEPHFSLCYTKHVIDGPDLLYVNDDLEDALREELDEDKVVKAMELIKETGSVQDLPGVSGHLKDVFKTALEIDPIWHIRMQASFQKYTDNAVSKTVNGPKTMTVEEVKQLYMTAFELGCKGMTFYRNGSRDFQPMSVGTGAQGEQVVLTAPAPAKKERGDRLIGVTRRMNTGCGKLYIIINRDEDGQIVEVFCQLGKAGGCASAQMQTIGKLASTGLRRGVPVEDVVAMLKGTRCSQIAWGDSGPIFSCADAIAKAIELELKGESTSDVPLEEEVKHFGGPIEGVGLCPDCGVPLRSEGGCVSCSDPSCGYSRCG